MRKNRFGLLFVLVVVALLAAQCAPAATPAAQETGKTYKLAAIFPGVITDADYNTLAYVGISELQKATGVQTAYSESVAVPDVDRVMREYIDGGYNIIWTHGGQFLTQ
uniref:BMP family ABC transporter substrate-binding protein n=1 Tax=Bellilinea sp. TaxID=2838785 RepID=UPI002ADE5E9C